MATYKGHRHDVLSPTFTERDENGNLYSINPVSPSTRVNPFEHGTRPKNEYSNRSIGRFMGKANQWIDKTLGGDLTQTILQGNANKTWRAMIVLNRMGLNPLKYTDKYVFDYIDKGVNFLVKPGGLQKKLSLVRGKKYKKVTRDTYDYTGENTWEPGESSLGGTHRADARRILVGRDLNLLKADKQSFKGTFTMFSDYPSSSRDEVEQDKSEGMRNSILIFNPLIESGGKAMYVELQNRPPELDYQPQSSWADIKSMGRNVPMYHYTGSETTLQFTTSWYMPGKPGDEDFDMFWVLNQCRTLESWSMANGYLMAPPYLYILWGEADIFSEHLWILQSATYKLKDFHDRVLLRDTESDGAIRNMVADMNRRGSYSLNPRYQALVNQGLVPFSATQELIFKRVAGINLWYNDIKPGRVSLKTDYSKLSAQPNQ